MYQQQRILKIHQFILGCLLLTTYGCIGGGGGGSSSGPGGSSAGLAGASIDIGGSFNENSLNENGDPGNQEGDGPAGNEEGGSTNTQSDGGVTIAKIHNPEPATMFLLGSGLMAVRCYRKRSKN